MTTPHHFVETTNSKAILPLNVNTATYQAICSLPPPKNLGIAIIGFANSQMDINDKLSLVNRLVSVQRMVAELASLAKFRLQFVPEDVEHVTVIGGMYREHEEFDHFVSPDLNCWRSRGLFLQVALFNGDRTFAVGDEFRFGIAANFIDRWNRDFGPTDRSRTVSSLLGENDAKLYSEIVGDIFADGTSVWPDSVQAFRNAILVGGRTFLNGGSMLQSMTDFANGAHKHYWESLE